MSTSPRASVASGASDSGSSVCRTTKSESSYSSIFGRWWPLRASSTASGWRPNSLAISAISSSVGSDSATQTKHSGRLTYSLMSADRNVAELAAVLVRDAVDEHGRFPIRGCAGDRRWQPAPTHPARGAARLAHAILIDCASVVVARSTQARRPRRPIGPTPCPHLSPRVAPPRHPSPRRPALHANSRCCSRSPPCSSRTSSTS